MRRHLKWDSCRLCLFQHASGGLQTAEWVSAEVNGGYLHPGMPLLTLGVEWHLQIVPSIYLYVQEKPVGRLPGDWTHPKTPGYHRGIPAADMTPHAPTPIHPRSPLLRGHQSYGQRPFTHPAVLMLHSDSCSRTVTGSARLLITELTHWAAMYFGPCSQNTPFSVAATELHNKHWVTLLQCASGGWHHISQEATNSESVSEVDFTKLLFCVALGEKHLQTQSCFVCVCKSFKGSMSKILCASFFGLEFVPAASCLLFPTRAVPRSDSDVNAPLLLLEAAQEATPQWKWWRLYHSYSQYCFKHLTAV